MTGHRWPVYGHDWAVAHLRKGLAHERIRHAYLLVGPASVGKETLARAFAQALNCDLPTPEQRPCGQCRPCRLIASGNHPDVLYSELDPNTGALKIETVREVASRLALKPFEARYRVAIFRDFDHAQPRAQDALLKTLEEPPPHALLILLAQSTDVLLPTITSRSQVLPLRLVPAAQVAQALVDGWGAEPDQAALLAQLSGGRIGWAVQALTDPTALDARAQALEMLEQCLGLNRAGRFALAGDLSKDKLALVALLEVWQTWWRDLLLVREGSGLAPSNVDREATLQEWAQRLTADEVRRALRATRETLGWLAHNVNTRLALEVLLLDYPGLVRA